MKKGTKIAIGIGAVIGASVIGYFIWKSIQDKNTKSKESLGSASPERPKKLKMDFSGINIQSINNK